MYLFNDLLQFSVEIFLFFFLQIIVVQRVRFVIKTFEIYCVLTIRTKEICKIILFIYLFVYVVFFFFICLLNLI